MLGPLIMEQHPQSLQSPWASFPHPAQHSLAVTAQAFSLPVHFELCLLQHCHLPQCQPRPAPSYEATRRSSMIPETKCDKDINCLSYVLHGVKRAGAMEHPSHNDTHAGLRMTCGARGGDRPAPSYHGSQQCWRSSPCQSSSLQGQVCDGLITRQLIPTNSAGFTKCLKTSFSRLENKAYDLIPCNLSYCNTEVVYFIP